MPFNVLLLPLLGGFALVTRWNYTRYRTKRYSGERLIFYAAIAGIFLLVAAFLTILMIAWRGFRRCIQRGAAEFRSRMREHRWSPSSWGLLVGLS
jgi:NADH:ubiquinone oxidoreductase subunit 4 (subunit M)